MKEALPAAAPAEWTAWAPGLPAPPDVLSMYRHLAPDEFFADCSRRLKRRCNNRVFNDPVVIWLMITQRLGNGTMETAVLELLRGLPEDFWPNPCKRLQSDSGTGAVKLSSNTGSYNNARQQLPLVVVEQCADRVMTQLIQQMDKSGRARPRPAFFVDGSSMRLPCTPGLREKYPPGSNQFGPAHWPLVRIVVAHDLYTGLAMRPEWGPMYGGQAVGEQQLLEKALDRLPPKSVLVGDANFGVFSVVHAAARRGHPVVMRLTEQRAKRLAGEDLRDETDLAVEWKPSREDRNNHPELPEDACVKGRLIVRRVQPSDGKEPILLALFTTLPDPAGQIVELYGYRWNIETDLRSLKSTLGMEQLNCTTPDMVAKEIDVAMLAYNLVRAVTWLAAEKTGLKPRQFGFTRVRNVVNAFAPLIAAATDPRNQQELFEKMMYYAGQARLARRRRKRSTYPRKVWPKPSRYPKHKQE